MLTLTDSALARILEIRSGEEDPGGVCLFVEITGMSGPNYAYDLRLAEISDASIEDDVSVQGGLTVVVAAGSVDRMRGSTLDHRETRTQTGLVITNPNPADPLAGRTLELTGDIAEKVTQLLEAVVNPELAGHGGFASLVGVDDTTVFLSMGGGCQGCAASAATLRGVIQERIMTAIPEVTEVVDVTDHAAGENPFLT